MKQFNDIRILARDKRDQAIKKAREVYQAELKQINELELRLKPRKPSQKGKPKPSIPLREKIMEVAPKGSHFTVAEILKRLELPETDKVIVRSTFDKMIRRGDIKRVRRGRNKVPAIFAVSTLGPPTNPVNDLPQIQAAELVLRELGRPVELVVLIVEMLERGFNPSVNELALKKSLRSAMAKSDKFLESDGLWSISSN